MSCTGIALAVARPLVVGVEAYQVLLNITRNYCLVKPKAGGGAVSPATAGIERGLLDNQDAPGVWLSGVCVDTSVLCTGNELSYAMQLKAVV